MGVLITRPPEQATGLCAAIRALGGVPVPFPVLAIEAIGDDAGWNALAEGLRRCDWAIFISPNAVRHAVPVLRRLGDWPAALRVAVVGGGSARELARWGHTADLVPAGRAGSEGLLALPGLRQVAGRRVMVFRGQGGRELLAETLRARGAEVDYAEVYRRVMPPADSATLIARWRRGEVGAVTVTSNQALRNLYEMLGEPGRELLLATPLVVVSERGAALARRLGFRAGIRIARSAADVDLVAALGACPT